MSNHDVTSKDRREICRTAVQTTLFEKDANGVSNFHRHCFNHRDVKEAVEMYPVGILMDIRNDLSIDEKFNDLKALVMIKKIIADEFESAAKNGHSFPEALRTRRMSPTPVKLEGLWAVQTTRAKHAVPSPDTLAACQLQSNFALMIEEKGFEVLKKRYSKYKKEGILLTAGDLPVDLDHNQSKPFAKANKFSRLHEIAEMDLIGHDEAYGAKNIIDPAGRMYDNTGGTGMCQSKFGRNTFVSAEAVKANARTERNFAKLIQETHRCDNVENWVDDVVKNPDLYSESRPAIYHAFGYRRMKETGMCDVLAEIDATTQGLVLLLAKCIKLWNEVKLTMDSSSLNRVERHLNFEVLRALASKAHPKFEKADIKLARMLKKRYSHFLAPVALRELVAFVKSCRNRAQYGGGKKALAGAMTGMEQVWGDDGMDWDYGDSDNPKQPTIPNWFKPMVHGLTCARSIMKAVEKFCGEVAEVINMAFPFLPAMNSYSIARWQNSVKETGLPPILRVGKYTYQPPTVRKWKGHKPFKINFHRHVEDINGDWEYKQSSTTSFAYQLSTEGTESLALTTHATDAAIIALVCIKLAKLGIPCLTIHDAILINPRFIDIAQKCYWEAFCEVLGLTKEEFPFLPMLAA